MRRKHSKSVGDIADFSNDILPQNRSRKNALVPSVSATQIDEMVEFDAERQRFVQRFAVCREVLDACIRSLSEAGVELGSAVGSSGDRKQELEAKELARNHVIETLTGCLKMWNAKELTRVLKQATDLHPNADACEALMEAFAIALFPHSMESGDEVVLFYEIVDKMPHRDVLRALLTELQVNRQRSTLQRQLFSGPTNTANASAPSVMRNAPNATVDWKNASAESIAVLLTKISLQLFRRLSVEAVVRSDVSHHGTDAGLTKRFKDLPPMFLLRSRSQKLSRWVASVILSEEIPSERVKVLQRILNLLTELMKLRNAHDAYTVVLGLNGAAIARLKSTWSSVPERDVSRMRKITQTFAPPYKNLRELKAKWEEDGSAFLPSVEVLLQMQAKLNEVEPDFLPEQPTLANVWKIQLLGKWVSNFFSGFRKRFFKFEQDHDIRNSNLLEAYFDSLPNAFDEDTLYKMSKRISQMEQLGSASKTSSEDVQESTSSDNLNDNNDTIGKTKKKDRKSRGSEK